MDLSKYYEKFRDSLLHAFPSEGDLTMFVQFALGVTLNHVVGGHNLREKAFYLIQWADAEGRIDELFEKALERRPNNPRLIDLAAKLAAEAKTEHEALEYQIKLLYNEALENANAQKVRNILSAYKTSGRLEALIVRVPNLRTGQSVSDWRSQMHESERRICSISKNGAHTGTGFLIGNNRIITNAHVVKVTQALEHFDVRFGFVAGTARDHLPTYRLVEELARSQPREYDFAIFRLDQIPEGNRGYFKPKSYLFTNVREPVSILGHPNGDPLSFSFGVVFDNNSFMGRIAYTANTAPGSSGSPVFTENWDLVALHHHGEENINNHGIPMRAILSHLEANGKEELMEKA